MRKIFLNLSMISALAFAVTACSSDDGDDVDNGGGNGGGGTTVPTGIDLKKYSSGTEVMMQAFYWDVPSGGTWYDVIKGKVPTWATAGINKIWLPAPGKGASGGYSMGYDPYDYFDVGEYDQKGSTETRFGSRAELEALLKTIHDNKMTAIADIVMNHNSGADVQETTPSHGLQWTKFTPKSGKFLRTYADFVPYNGNTDEGESGFGEQLDLSNTRVQNELWASTTSVAQFYKGLGFDGWRFDMVKGFKPERVKQWNAATGNLFSVGEYWDGNATTLNAWANASGSPVFDFALFYNLEKAFDSKGDLTILNNDALFKQNVSKAVTFVTNHDADERDASTDNWIANKYKPLAYAYILTHPGTPTIFYSDYESRLNKTDLNNLILINKTIAKGTFKVLYIGNNEYIAAREGDGTNPGLVVYINGSNTIKQHTVTTHWKGKKLFDYTKHTVYSSESQLPTTDASGSVKLTCPAGSYTVWSINN